MKQESVFALVFILAALSACSITRTANPVSMQGLSGKEICVIENTSVKKRFLPMLRTALESKGFIVKQLGGDATVSACPLVSTYTARWSWDFKSYMGYAEIIVYRNGTRAGDALYQAPTGGMSMTSEIYEADELKVKGMVDRLFPGS